jgi:hypothetical protein
MKLRSPFAMMAAIAMIFASLVVQSGAAMAAMPSDHHSQMMEKGHCGEQPAKDKDGNPTGKSCCVAMCAAVAVNSTMSVSPLAYAPGRDQPAVEQSKRSFLAELPTPPPRAA